MCIYIHILMPGNVLNKLNIRTWFTYTKNVYEYVWRMREMEWKNNQQNGHKKPIQYKVSCVMCTGTMDIRTFEAGGRISTQKQLRAEKKNIKIIHHTHTTHTTHRAEEKKKVPHCRVWPLILGYAIGYVKYTSFQLEQFPNAHTYPIRFPMCWIERK